MLDYVNRHLFEDDVKTTFAYKFGERLYCCHTGEWKNQRYEESVVEQGLRIGSINDSSGYLLWTGFTFSEQGYFPGVAQCCEKLHEIGDLYENDWAHTRKYLLNTTRLLNCRRLGDVVDEANQRIPVMQEAGYPLYAVPVLSIKAQACTLLNLISEAEEALRQAREIIERHGKVRVIALLYNWHLSEFFFDLHKWEKAIDSEDKSNQILTPVYCRF